MHFPSLSLHANLPLLLLALLAGLHAGDATGPTPFPDPKDEKAWAGTGPIRVHDWMRDNRKYFWSQRDQAQGAVVFVGDSLTGGWKAEQMKAGFPGMKLANRGIGGDVSRGVFFRFREDVLDLKPKAIVLLIGTNDLSSHAAPAGIVENISAIIAQARTYSATVPIVLCTVSLIAAVSTMSKSLAWPSSSTRRSRIRLTSARIIASLE